MKCPKPTGTRIYLVSWKFGVSINNTGETPINYAGGGSTGMSGNDFIIVGGT